MKIKTLSFLLLSLFLLLSACSPLTTIVSSSGQQPTPVESYELGISRLSTHYGGSD